jgi:hypothetical protein
MLGPRQAVYRASSGGIKIRLRVKSRYGLDRDQGVQALNRNSLIVVVMMRMMVVVVTVVTVPIIRPIVVTIVWLIIGVRGIRIREPIRVISVG